MKASELIEALQPLIDLHGDLDVTVDAGVELRNIEEIDLAAEEDACFAIWFH